MGRFSLAKSPASSSTWLILRRSQKGKTADMDAIRKKMQSLKSETDGLYNTIAGFEEEDKKSAEQLCQTITKLALTSKAADNVMKTIKVVENTCLNNEVTIEELDKNLRATVKVASDNEQKLDELSR